jgi:large subunit ribosomal protein L28
MRATVPFTFSPPEELLLMPRACAICGKSAAFGSNVSHSKVHTRRRFDANLHATMIGGDKLLVCSRCRRTQTKDARMAKKREKAKAR